MECRHKKTIEFTWAEMNDSRETLVRLSKVLATSKHSCTRLGLCTRKVTSQGSSLTLIGRRDDFYNTINQTKTSILGETRRARAHSTLPLHPSINSMSSEAISDPDRVAA